MRPIFHIIAESLDPHSGGMAESTIRVASILAEFEASKVILYPLEAPRCIDNMLSLDVDVVDLARNRDALLQGFGGDRAKLRSESYRLESLLLRNQLQRRSSAPSSELNILVSFFISRGGFVAQQVASALKLPHIASVRGTDFSRDFFDPRSRWAVEFVASHADWVVTTNLFQEESLRVYRRDGLRIETIYNSLPQGFPKEYWVEGEREIVEIVADCGYYAKKGTLILVEAVRRVLSRGLRCRLTLVGGVDERATAFWEDYRGMIRKEAPESFVLGEWVSKTDLRELLLNSDIYATASLGEGCANGSLYALALGIPVVGTRCGALADLGSEMSNVSLAPPGDIDAFTDILAEEVVQSASHKRIADVQQVLAVRRRLARENESSSWRRIVMDLMEAQSRYGHPPRSQPRILLFVHDGGGLGHLRRISRIASSLQGPCACLIVSGHRAGAWMVPESCEYLHIPSMDSLLPKKAAYWGRDPFVQMGENEMISFRKKILRSIVDSFRPDAIVVDYLPLGKFGELEEVLENAGAKKYLVLRGILDTEEKVREEILGGRAQELIHTQYDRVLVACDKRVCEIEADYEIPENILRKLVYVGYVVESILQHEVENVRRKRGLKLGESWVVCSAGGGRRGESLIERCVQISECDYSSVVFDVVAGPKSRIKFGTELSEVEWRGRNRYMAECRQLPTLHASADVVVCSGGYNSVVEALSGGTSLVCVPIQGKRNYEQHLQAVRLRRFYSVTIVEDLRLLGDAIQAATRTGKHCAKEASEILDFNGVVNIRRLLLADLGVS